MAKDYLLCDQYIRASRKYIIEDDYFKGLVQDVTDIGFRQLVIQAMSPLKPPCVG